MSSRETKSIMRGGLETSELATVFYSMVQEKALKGRVNADL
jgi:hypothetical protein